MVKYPDEIINKYINKIENNLKKKDLEFKDLYNSELINIEENNKEDVETTCICDHPINVKYLCKIANKNTFITLGECCIYIYNKVGLPIQCSNCKNIDLIQNHIGFKFIKNYKCHDCKKAYKPKNELVPLSPHFNVNITNIFIEKKYKYIVMDIAYKYAPFLIRYDSNFALDTTDNYYNYLYAIKNLYENVLNKFKILPDELIDLVNSYYTSFYTIIANEILELSNRLISLE